LRSVHIIVCTLFFFSAFSQKKDQSINISNSNNSLYDLISIIEDNTDYFFTYNSNIIPVKELTYNAGSKVNYKLEDILFEIENQFLLDVKVESSPTQKIILSPTKSKVITGYIVDMLSDETIIGATIFSNSNVATVSDINGYFRIVIPVSDSMIFFQNMGYLQDIYVPKTKFSRVNIQLESNSDLNIIITPDPQIKIKQDIKVDVDEINTFKGISGTPDLFSYLRSQPSISSGSEGQNGLIIRGGGPDQNLILLDGFPIYEGSHLGGLSSIFLPSAIKNISLYKSAFPARYGGRLSGVLDVTLNDGDSHNFNRSVSIGIEGLTAHIDGPLDEKTTISFNGKLSWFSRLIEPIVKTSSNINDFDLNYNDSYVKLKHRFSKKQSLSFVGYIGEDLVKIRRSGTEPNNFQDFNRISWGNKVIGVNYRSILNDHLTLNAKVGISNYNYRSRGTYELRANESGNVIERSFDILSLSNLTDIIFSPQLDYYSDKLGKFTFGFNYTKHNNEPTIIESDQFTPNDNDVKVDTTYKTDELALFVENTFWFTPKVYVNSGLRFNAYFNNDIEYLFLQPRFSINYKHKNKHVQLSYARMSQFTHLLSNPGLGIPSDLWVPSTSIVPPESSHNFSFDYKQFNGDFNWGFSVFFKFFQNTIEYSNPTDILYSFILDEELFQISIDNNSWEDRVSLGNGESYGIETYLNYKIGNFSYDLAYTFSRSKRAFENFNNGESFPYKFDRPHDINTNLTYRIGENKSFSIHWTFGIGNAYTITDEIILGPEGRPIARASSRNNNRVPNFHHLDVNYEVTKKLENNTLLKLSLGIYNIYNRQNPFYEYLAENNTGQLPDLVTISLFPVLPQLNIQWSW